MKEEEEYMQEDSLWEQETNSDFEDSSEERGEPITNRENLVSEIFETNSRLERLKHRWRGNIEVNGIWVRRFEPLASDAFINKSISNAEAVIDKINSFSKKDEKECKRILHDATKAFILDCVDEESVKNENMRTMAKSFEHSIELFLGLVEFGHGSEVLTNTVAGLGLRYEDKNKNKGGVMKWLKGET